MLPSQSRRSIGLGLAIFFVTLAVNLLSANPGLTPVTYPDTGSYLSVTQQLLRGESPYLHSRTPGYPIFLLVAEMAGSWEYIVVLQAIVGALASVALWRMLAVPLRSETWGAVAAVALTTEYTVSQWHGLALTESLSISLLIVWLSVHLVNLGAVAGASGRWRPYYRWLALALDITLMMQRAAFFFLPACWYVALLVLRALRLRGLRPARSLAVNLGIVLVVVIAWCGMISARYGRFEITIISRYNRLGNLMGLGFASRDACERHACSPLTRRGVELASADTMKEHGPYRVVNQLASEFPTATDGAILDSLNRVLSPGPLGRMELRAFRRVAFIFSQRGWYNPGGRLLRSAAYRAYSSLVSGPLRRLSEFAVAWTALFIALAYRLKREVDAELWVRFALLFAATYVAGVNMLGAYADWARFMAPAVIPLNALALFLLLDLVRGTMSRLRMTKKA